MTKQARHRGIEERLASDGTVSYRAKVRIKGHLSASITPQKLLKNQLKTNSDQSKISLR